MKGFCSFSDGTCIFEIILMTLTGNSLLGIDLSRFFLLFLSSAQRGSGLPKFKMWGYLKWEGVLEYENSQTSPYRILFVNFACILFYQSIFTIIFSKNNAWGKTFWILLWLEIFYFSQLNLIECGFLDTNYSFLGTSRIPNHEICKQ